MSNRYERQAGAWVYDELRERIENLVYKPGQELQTASLTLDLGLSRSPVRDALLRLERDRLVDIFPQKGTRVAFLDRKIILQERFLRQTLEVRIFEEFLRKEYSQKDRLILMSRLDGALLQQKTALLTSDSVAFLSSDMAFHRIFYDELNYERIYKVVMAHTGNERRIRLLNNQVGNVMENVYNEHRAIADAIGSGDRESAARLLGGHFGKLSEELDMLVKVFPTYFTDDSARQ